jgi:hypothetical protein
LTIVRTMSCSCCRSANFGGVGLGPDDDGVDVAVDPFVDSKDDDSSSRLRMTVGLVGAGV